MVSKRMLKDYDLPDIESYFDYIIKVRLNGNSIEALSLINEMSTDQKQDLIDHISYMDEDETLQILAEEIKETIK
jgi:hypothetical protein